MICLGIETSCDDTSLALVEGKKVLAEASSSQARLHALFGGVVPEIASREHARYIGPLADALLRDAGIDKEDIDAVAVARGPGLLGSLLVGMAFAKSFSFGMNIPLIGVNHLYAHLLAASLTHEVEFPALGLLVSGGHTHIYRINGINSFVLLGKSLDDAAGEAFDKAGKMLGLPYPAGKHIDQLSQKGNGAAITFPRPYLDNDTLDFSFSGLKTAMAGYLSQHAVHTTISWNLETGQLALSPEDEATLADLCASYSAAIIDTLIKKLSKALKREKGIRSLVLAGGVAANSGLRSAIQYLATSHALPLYIPEMQHCTDNGVMVAYLGGQLLSQGFYHPLSVEAVPRGRVIPQDMLR